MAAMYSPFPPLHEDLSRKTVPLRHPLNSPIISFSDFITSIVLERVRNGSLVVIGKVGEVLPPMLWCLLPLIRLSRACVMMNGSLISGSGTYHFLSPSLLLLNYVLLTPKQPPVFWLYMGRLVFLLCHNSLWLQSQRISLPHHSFSCI